MEATASEDEVICFGLVFKRKKVADVAILAESASDGRASSFRENPSSASSPRVMVVHEGRGRVPLEPITARLLLLNFLLSSNRPCNVSKTRR